MAVRILFQPGKLIKLIRFTRYMKNTNCHKSSMSVSNLAHMNNEAPMNISIMYVTAAVFHLLTSPLNDEA